MTTYKYLGNIDNIHYCAKIFFDCAEESSIWVNNSLIYAMFVDMCLITNVNDKIVIFEFYSYHNSIVIKIIHNDAWDYVISSINEEIIKYDAVLDNYLKENKYSLTINCAIDPIHNYGSPTIIKQSGNLNEENCLKKKSCIDHIEFFCTH